MDMAKQASESFVKEGTSLNDAVSSLADRYELNPLQIRRVVEMANHDVQQSLYKNANDKTFTFDLADADAIIKKLQSPAVVKVAFESVMAASSGKFEGLAKTASEESPRIRDEEGSFRDHRFDIDKVAQHVSHFLRELELRKMVVSGEIEDSMNKIARMAKDHIIANNGMLSDLLKFACCKDPEFSEGWKTIFESIKDDLMKFGAPVDKALLLDSLEIPDGTLEVINGGHTLAVELDTLKNKISEEDRVSQKLRLMDTFGDAVVNRIRVLKTPKDMDESIIDDIWSLSKKAEEGLDAFVEYMDKGGGWKRWAVGVPLALGTGYAAGKFIEGASKGASKELSKDYNLRKRMEHLTAREG
jgi:hypothetical protein